MNKIVVIPDSFKGTLTSTEICKTIKNKIRDHFPLCNIVGLPIADGGEGSIDCFLKALNGERVYVECHNAFDEKITSFYGKIDNCAIVEMALVAGLPLAEGRENPLITSTFGVGELIKAATYSKANEIIVCLGGSCTNDFGCGAAAACGIKFFDENKKEFVPTGGTLSKVSKIDVTMLSEKIKDKKFRAICDVDNPPYGKFGAAHIFAPQKGADEKTVKLLDAGAVNLCNIIKKDLGIDVSDLKGGGAAGAFGAGMKAFFGAELKSGIDTVLDTVMFDKEIKDADLVITGEGCIDAQSTGGKAISGIAKRCKKANVPLIVIAGAAKEGIDDIYNMGVTAVFTINRLPEDFSVSCHKSLENLEFAADNIIRLIKGVL